MTRGRGHYLDRHRGLVFPPSVMASGGGPAPANLVLPTLTGGDGEGDAVTCVSDLSDWTNATSLVFTWFFNGTAIDPVHNENPYTLRNDDIGSTITCEVTATGPGGSTSVETTDSRLVVKVDLLWSQVTLLLDDGQATDYSDAGHDPTFVNGASFQTGPDPDQFDCNNSVAEHMSIANHPDFEPGAADWAMEIFGWQFANYGLAGFGEVTAMWEISGNQRSFQLDRSGVTTFWRILTSINGTAFVTHNASVGPTIGPRYNLLMQRRGNLIELYVDGTRVISSTFTGTMFAGTSPLLFSRNFAAGTGGFGNFHAARFTNGSSRETGTSYTEDTLPLAKQGPA